MCMYRGIDFASPGSGRFIIVGRSEMLRPVEAAGTCYLQSLALSSKYFMTRCIRVSCVLYSRLFDW